MPAITLNEFREKLPIEQAMELDNLIRWQPLQEIARRNYDDETTGMFFYGTLQRKDPLS